MRSLFAAVCLLSGACVPAPEPACPETRGTLCPYAGTGFPGVGAEDEPRLDSPLYLPQDVAVGPDGRVWVVDWNNHRVRRVEEDGTVATVIGTATIGDRPEDLSDLRAEMSLILERCGITVECHHHEVATAGQCEIDIRYATMLGTADNLQLFKYVVRNTAYQYGKTATFMPKPLYGDNGSGMHCHQSLWKGEKPLFAGDGYAGLSEMARFYIGGLLKHAAAIVAFAAPTTNSYKRLVPGFEAPVNLAY